MNYESRNVKAVPAISLAEEADFSIGPLRVCPSARLVNVGERSETIEPRVMQVLVVLARAAGNVVSREQLIDRCWGGRIVGDDAVSSTIVKVRALARLCAEPAFEIETIPRVGYRLIRRETVTGEPLSADPVSSAVPSKFPSWRWLLAGLAVAIAALVGSLIAARYLYSSHEAEWIVAESHMPFIATADIESFPAIAPDGTMIAYAAGPDRQSRHLYLRLIKGGDPIQLTHDAYDAAAPAWSPDGKTIVYRISQEGHPCGIMEISVPAGQPREAGRCRVSQWSEFSFDPSGRSLFYVDAPAPGAPEGIFRLDLDNGRVSAVTHPARRSVSDGFPAVSPGGRELLYVRNIESAAVEVRVLTFASGADRRIAAFEGTDATATWSKDGQTIFLSRSSEVDGDKSLWAYPLSRGNPSRILTTGDHLGRLSAGPDGLLAMEMSYPGGQLVAVTPHSGLPPKPIPSNGLYTWCVDYAPDGTFLATGRRGETQGVWIGGKNGSLHELLSTGAETWALRWSPDGTRFAFTAWLHRRRFEVRVFKREGEPIAQFRFQSNDYSGLLDWTADGKSILTSRQETKGWRIWKTDLATPGKSVPITPYGWRDPRVHGTMLLATRDGVAGIWRIDGTPRRVADGPAPERSYVYTIAGDRLVYSDTSDPKHPMFSAVSLNGGPKERLAPLPDGQYDFTFGVDPKSGDIVYTQETDNRDIGLLRMVKR
ncbi:MAG: PD40 domain-containing protein [Alphaproteobacteria bacterium]|nr:PD40 domain-containing protein [Alphaproteobacteria bacterium]